ncbi:TPA: hypothetical protein ACH3X1_009575 [Trebouxia sp. C0004]
MLDSMYELLLPEQNVGTALELQLEDYDSRQSLTVADLKHSLATSQAAANKIEKQYPDERDKCRAASLAAADAQAQSARLQKQQQDAHREITGLRHSLVASQSALDILKEQAVKDAASAQEGAHQQSSCKSLTQKNCSLGALLVDAKQKIKEMQQTHMTCLRDSIESYGAERAGRCIGVHGCRCNQTGCMHHMVHTVLFSKHAQMEPAAIAAAAHKSLDKADSSKSAAEGKASVLMEQAFFQQYAADQRGQRPSLHATRQRLQLGC